MQNSILGSFKLLVTDRSLSFDVVIFSILFLAIPIVLVTGPALPDIFLSLIAFYFVYKSFLQKNWQYYKNPIVIGFLTFSGYGIIRSLFSEIPLESLTNEGSVFYFRYIFFSMGVWYLLDKNPYLSKCFLLVIIICIVVVSLDGIYQYIFDVNIFNNEKHGVDRLTGLFGTEPIIGRYISYLSLLAFVLIYQNLKISKKVIILSLILLVTCEIIIFLSGERAPLFSVSLFAILILIFIPHFRLYRIVGIFSTILIIFVISFYNPTAKTRIWDNTIEEISETTFPFLPYSIHHEQHYASVLKMFIDKPIFGVGTNTFRFNCDKPQYKHSTVSCSSHPHQYYLQVLGELGITGFVFLISFYLYLLFIVFKQFFYVITSNKHKQIPFELFNYPIILFVYWWPLIPHMSFYNNWNNVLIMMPLGFFMKNFLGNKNYGYSI